MEWSGTREPAKCSFYESPSGRLPDDPLQPQVTVDWDWSRVVFDHVKIGVRDAEASRTFYHTVLATLDWEGEHGGQYANLVVSANAEPGGPIHIAFVARSRAEVDAFHRAGVEAGYADNGAPGVREQYSSDEAGRYYAAFLLDPDGNRIEAVCHRP